MTVKVRLKTRGAFIQKGINTFSVLCVVCIIKRIYYIFDSCLRTIYGAFKRFLLVKFSKSLLIAPRS